MKSDFEKLPEKYSVGFENLRYITGKMSFIYSVSNQGLIAKISRNIGYRDFDTEMCLHQDKIARKLAQKGYPVPEIQGVYKIYHRDREVHVPGFVNEDKSDLGVLRAVPGMFYNYFNDYYEDLLRNAEKDGFLPGDTNPGNCLCDLRNRTLFLIDYDDWEYFGRGKKILSPRRVLFEGA